MCRCHVEIKSINLIKGEKKIMENKPSMSRVERLHREKVTRYSIRKYSFGAASVAVAALFMFLGNGAVSANELSKQETSVEATTPTLDKTQLESYISEIETKLSNGSYDNKTEESVAVLKADLEAAKATLANATTQAELKQAYSKLVTTANARLRNKPVEKKETPVVDTTNGQPTVGKTAENTEPTAGTNSIENSGSKDERNGQALDKNNAFRTETAKTVGDITYTTEFSNDTTKEIYVYNKEEANVEFKINSATNKVTSVEITKGSNQKFTTVNDTTVTDGYGYNFEKITTETDTPLTVRMTGQPNDTIMGNKNYTKTEAQNFAMGERYLRVTAKDGSTMSAAGSGVNAEGYFKIVLKSQTYKYSIQEPASNADKIAVSNIDSLTEADIAKIKAQIKIEHSKTSTDARLESKKGQLVDNQSSIVKSIDVDTTSKKVVVTYTDDSTDETPLSNVARTNEPPTVEFPYSDAAKREIYVYGAEENSFDIKIKDDADKIAAATVLQGGKKAFNPVADETDKINTQYGYTANVISTETPATEANPAVIRYSGTPKAVDGLSQDSLDAATKGETPQGLVLGWRYVAVTDVEGTTFVGSSGKEVANDSAFRVMLKPQTQKYDVTTPENEADKLPVVDANNVTDAEFKKLVGANNANIKLHYSKTNTDANLVAKQGQNVDDKADKIKSVTKVANNMVVTYNDGSTDTLPLTDFARTNQAPTVEIPYSVDGKKDVYVYANEDFEIPVKFTDDSGKIASATIKRGGNQDSPAKDASNPDVLDNEYNTTVEKISTETPATAENPAIVKIKGNISKDNSGIAESKFPKEPAQELTIVTRYATATDTDGAFIENTAKGNTYATDPGAFTIKLKAQTAKYDIKDLDESDKVAVADPTAVADDEFNAIKEKIKIEFSKTNEDKNLEAKRGQEVTDKDSKIDTITKDGNNLVVTYKDGSKDVRPLTDFTKLDKQPAIDAVNTAATEKIAAINATPNATDEEKAAAVAKVNADKEKALTAINDATTKTALDTAKNAGTSAIAADNPVVAKKDAAKADVEAARKAKEDAIKANPNLTQAEKDAAIAKNNTAAAEATKAIDAATTNDAVDQAKTAGTTAIGKVNPVAKENAKEAIANALTAKNSEIDKRTDLSDAEKKAAKDEAQKLADAELAKINAQPDNADTADAAVVAQKIVNDAEDKGVADVISVNPVAKEAAKKAVADELTKKEEQIDARTDLTTEEKAAAKAEAKAKAKEATDAIDAQPSNAETPEKAAEAQTAVDGAKDKGVADVKAVDPVATKKPAAKKAIDDALTAKNNEIDARTDLTPEEKTKAKEIAKAKADAAKDAVDKATTDAEVDKAKTDGTTAVANVTPVAKEAAKTAIADALTAKNKEIDARTDLTDEEKTAAKKEAKDKADAQLSEIAKQPDAADTPEAAKTAQDAVDAAKKTGVDEVTAVNPAAVKKTEAKQAIDDALTAKNNAIDARTDLTDAEKKVAKDKATEEAKKAKETIDAATTDAAVDTAKTAGLDEVAKVNPVAKEAAKKAVADELAKKEAEIDARTDLTQEEKDAAKKDAQDKAKSATDAINEQPDNADTPEKAAEAQKAVDTAKKTGVDEVAAVNPEAVTKPAAKKAIDDKLAEQLKAIENTPDATDDEKKVAADAAKTLAEEAKKEIDKAGTDAAVKQLQDEAEKEIEKSVPVVEDKPNARKAIDEEAQAKKEAIDARDDLTPKAKEELKAQVDKIAEQAKKSVDAAKTAEAVNGIEESDKAAIKAVGEVNIPADKVLVNDPSALTDDEKAKVLEAVKKVNPDAKEITQDADGNITVTTPDGHQEIITPEQVVKTSDTANEPKAGNDVVKPADKVVVADPAKLTDAEKEKIKAAVEAVNPNSVVTVDEKGNAKVSTPDGQTQVIPVEELVRTVEDTKKPNAGNDIVKPADKTVVANPDALTPEEKKAIEDKVKAVNPGSTVVVDDKGNATVTTPEGKTAVIPASDLTKSAADAAKPNAGNDIVKPADKTVVANPDKLTDAEKKAIEDKVKAVNPDSTVVVDDKGNATVTTPEGKTAVIPASDLTKSAADAAKPNAGNDIVKPADKTVVANPDALTPEEKKAIEDKVKAVNPGSTVVVDDKGNATVTTPEGKTAVIPASDLTKSAADAAKPNAGNDIVKPADKTVVANPDKLTDAEKKAIEDKVKAVNPDATVVVDDKGNATVTTPEGKTAVIPASDLTKSAADAAKPNAGNDIVKPADKTVVANPDKLTDAEKKAIEDKVKAVNPDATVVVDDKGNATVTTPEGKTAVIPASDLTKSAADAAKPNAGNDIVKPADKTVVANPDALTPEEKKAIEDKVKAVNPDATVVVDDKGNATVTTPEGKTAVIPASDLTKSAADAAKPNAGNDIVKPADKTVVANPDALTPEEKKAIEDKVKAVNPGSTVVVDDKGNATVTTPEGKTAVIPASDLTKSAAEAAKPNAGNDIVKPADKTVVANPDALTPEEKKAIEDKVKAVNPGSTVVVDDKGNATVTTPEGKTAVIPASDLTKSPEDAAKANAGNAVNTPAAKVEVKDPANLTDEEKAKVKEAIEAVNPGSKVVVDDKGNATVTTPEGNTAVIPAADVTKSAADADKANAGNAVNTPAAKVEVKDSANLTDAEKKAIENKVKAVNPGSKVVVDDKGNATVTTPEGKTATIPAADLTKSAADAAKANAGNGANTPATKTVVKDPANLTDEEKAKVKKAVEDVNPGSTVVVNDKGDVIVTKGDGTVLVIPELDLVIPEDRLTDPTQQNGVNTPATRVLVGDKAKLTADEIEKVKESIKAVNPGATVVVDDKGNATVTTPEGKTATIPAAQLVKDAKDVAAKNNGENINVDFEKETVADLNNLTDAEKEAAKAKIKGANADVVEVIFDKAGNATVITKDGKVYTIVSKDIFKQRSSTDNGSSANTGQIVSEHTNARKGAKELPYTGTEDSVVSMVAAAASALLGLGLAGRRRKEDEEA